MGGLELTPERTLRVMGTHVRPMGEDSPPRWLHRLRRLKRGNWAVEPGDVVLVRLNPARDPHRAWAHETALALLRDAERRGIVVLNSPAALTHAGHKLYLHTLPARWMPKTLVTRDPDRIRAFLEEHDRCVVKPVTGTRGRDVFRLKRSDLANLNQIVDVLVRDGYAMVQQWAEGAEAGDVRLIVLEGRLLEVDGRCAAVRRVPGPGDFRSNVHAGGKAVSTEPTEAMRELVADVGPSLAADGVFLAGLDVIGSLVVEVNAWAPGGLFDAELMQERDFVGAVVNALVARAG